MLSMQVYGASSFATAFKVLFIYRETASSTGTTKRVEKDDSGREQLDEAIEPECEQRRAVRRPTCPERNTVFDQQLE
jgi:hypothetical protein